MDRLTSGPPPVVKGLARSREFSVRESTPGSKLLSATIT
jgi:hypothetical protein